MGANPEMIHVMLFDNTLKATITSMLHQVKANTLELSREMFSKDKKIFLMS